MFALSGDDLATRMLGCGDGPAAFNADATRRGCSVVSCDPIYGFDSRDIEGRIAATREQVLDQTRRHADEFVWGDTSGIHTVEELDAIRMAAMRTFLSDYPDGKAAGRYVDASLPALPFHDGSFDLALCSHLLFLYSTQLGEAFHQLALRDLGRVATEVRVFPLLELGGTRSPFVDSAARDLSALDYDVTIERVPYEFRRGGNEMMRIRRRAASKNCHIFSV